MAHRAFPFNHYKEQQLTHPRDEHAPLPEAPVRLLVLVPKEREAAFRALVEQFLNGDPSESAGHEEMLEALDRLVAVASSRPAKGVGGRILGGALHQV